MSESKIEFRFTTSGNLAPKLLAAEGLLLQPGDTRASVRARCITLGQLALARERGGDDLVELVSREHV